MIAMVTLYFCVEVLFVFVCVGVCMSAAPGWSIWKNGMWAVEDTDKDNIPGKLTYFTSFPENYWTYNSL